MPRKMEVVFLKAEPWKKGREVAGFFEEVKDTKAQSRTVIMNTSGKHGDDIAVWETASLANFVAQMEPGKFYAIRCNGLKKFKEGGNEAWDFDLLAFDDNEVDAAIRKHANKETLFT